MYSGEAIVPQDDISSFLKTAEMLEIKGLLENSQETKNNKNKTSNAHHFGSACFKNSELTVTTKKFDKTDCQSSSQVTNISSTAAKLCKSNPLIRAYEANTKRSAVTSTHSSQENKKSNRNYEATAPVFDNRNIYPVDVVQPHFDYSGKTSLLGELNIKMINNYILYLDEYDGELQEDPPPASGIEDCGPFKKVWSYRYLCYNLGKEILCLLCFCRFTQFKKFNLDRHMRNKHQSLYHIDDETKKKILDVVGCRSEKVLPDCCV